MGGLTLDLVWSQGDGMPQMITVSSSEAEAIKLPSGEKATQFTL